MSIIQTLSEGIVNRDMKKEGQALLTKWEATGLLEGLDTQQSRHNMARLLENQAKELLRESNSMSSGAGIEGFASVAFPIVRRVFAGLIANELVSVQPMSLPSGLIFFLDFQYGDQLAGVATTGRNGNGAGKSIYGTDQVASQVTGGVNIVAADGGNIGGLRQQVGYAYSSPTGSNSAALTAAGAAAHGQHVASFLLDGTVSETNAKFIQYDPDLLALGTSDDKAIMIFELAQSFHDKADFDNLSAFDIDATALLAECVEQASGTPTATKVIRRLTSKVKAADSACTVDAIRYVVVMGSAAAEVSEDSSAANLGGSNSLAEGKLLYPQADTLTSTADKLGAIDGFNFPFEGNGDMPEIDIKVDSIAITAQTKKLKAKWTPELGQDLNAYHNLDAEVELTSILSEQIALEIDRELLADLVNGATAAKYYWSRSPGLFVNRVTGAELGATSAAPDFTGTVSEWYETLIETINDVSAQIHIKTLRGGANYVVCSPEVANILEFTSGFRANVTADADKGTIGAVKVGSLSRKFDIIVDPYFPRNAILVGRKGGSFLESGYVYAPYVPLQTTPTIFGVEDFVPRKGVMTRYGKKMVRPDMYGLVIVRGLLGEEGS